MLQLTVAATVAAIFNLTELSSNAVAWDDKMVEVDVAMGRKSNAKVLLDWPMVPAQSLKHRKGR